MKESILDIVHESSKELHKLEFLDTVTMRELDALCLPPVKQYTAIQIKKIRTKNKASQGVFAAYLNTSISTVQKWEQGAKRPQGASLKLIDIVERKGLEALR